MAKKGHRVLITNPDGEEIVLRGIAKYYVIVPVSEDLFEVHYKGKYLGESDTLEGAEKFIKRGGASAPVLIKNPNGGYEMRTNKYKSPSKSKKKSTKKKAAKRKPAKKKKSTKKKAAKRKPAKKKKSTKKKATKKKATKKKPAKRKPAKKKAAKRKPAKKKATKKKTKKKVTKKAEPKRKVSVDAAVRGHIKKTTGKKPVW